ncbi:MAG: hypothetical protein H3C63_08745 [Candidatus Omnitrophica bacterium]|nr:hypothetical protein [Candidatus Omnitrophota bacterium]
MGAAGTMDCLDCMMKPFCIQAGILKIDPGKAIHLRIEKSRPNQAGLSRLIRNFPGSNRKLCQLKAA